MTGQPSVQTQPFLRETNGQLALSKAGHFWGWEVRLGGVRCVG